MKNITFSSKIIKNHIRYDWWKYLLVMLIVSLLSYYITYLKNKIKPYERMQVFLSSEVIDKEYIKETYKLIDHTNIIEMTYYTCLPSEPNYVNSLQSQGLGNSDIILIPQEQFLGAYISYIVSFDSDLVNHCKSLYQNIEFLHYDNDDPNKICGVLVHSKSNNEYNKDLLINQSIDMNLNDNYYLLITTSSYNMGKYGKDTNRKTGLKLLDYFIKTNEN